jgi:methyl-accepting chemotaxis protein
VAIKTSQQEAEGPVEWLENELRDTKARLHKVEGELEQALKQLWSMEAELRRLTESSNVSGSVSATLAGLREDVRQLHGQMGKLEDKQSAVTNRTEELLRQRQAESGRDRQDLGALSRDVAAMAKNIEHYESRAQAVEETSRRTEEAAAGGRLSVQSFERQLEDLSTRTARAHEAAMRIEHDVARIGPELEKLAKDDAAQMERLQLAQEHARRLTERVDKLEAIAAFPEEARELLQRANFEREQLSQRLLQTERIAGEVTDRLQEFLQGTARLDQRTQTQAAELLEITSQLNELSDQTRSQQKRVLQVLLRQRRRQSEAIAQEIKELSQGDLQSGD